MGARYRECVTVKVNPLTAKKPFPVGCVYKDGQLKPAFSAVDTYSLPSEKVKYVRASVVGGGCFTLTDGNDLFISAIDDATRTSRILQGYETSTPFAFEGTFGDKRWFVLPSTQNICAASDGAYVDMDYKGSPLRCGVVRRGRVFAGDSADGFLLRWSAPDGFNNWEKSLDGAGLVRLDPVGGEIYDLFDYEDELIVIRAGGITRFSVNGSPENFKMICPTVCVEGVRRNSAAIVDNTLLFCAEDGLFSYSGGKLKRIEGLISEDMNSLSSACAYAERYYIASGNSAAYKREVVYVYDSVEDTYQIVDVPAYYVSCDGTSPLAYCTSALYRLQEGSYTYTGDSFDFGTYGRKLLKELRIDCDGTVSVKISNGRYTRVINDANGKIKLNMRGESFTVTFTGTGVVRSAEITAEVNK